MDENSLEIPHPGIAERDFVLRPLLDINPQIIHPKTNLSIQNLYENFLKNSDFKTSYPKKIFAIPQDGKKEINLDFSLKTYTMGVFNITPNSFYNPLESNDISKILKKIKESVSNFDIFDIGGESTNPKSQPISYQEEISRVLPLIKAIKKDHSFDNIMISLDTRKVKRIF